jgi:hypothetical protein
MPPDPVPPVLLGHRAREVDVRGVGHACRELPVGGFQAIVAHHEDDASRPSFPHVRKDDTACSYVPHEFQPEAAHPLVLGQLLEEAAGRAPRTCHEDVDTAELFDRGVHGSLDVSLHAHVPREGGDGPSRRLGDLRRHLLEPPLVSGGDGHVAPLFGQDPRRLATDALAPTGHDGLLPCELQIHGSSSVSDHDSMDSYPTFVHNLATARSHSMTKSWSVFVTSDRRSHPSGPTDTMSLTWNP